MKHQYFGDINDYRKYGLLRILSEDERRLAVCWMLTEPDGRPDGNRTHYISKPAEYRQYDSVLFDTLVKCIENNHDRVVHLTETTNILSPAIFFANVLTDDPLDRQLYFRKFYEFATDADIVFFDPDNGLEVKSTPCGKSGSSKYLYWSEVCGTFKNRHSILIYQHFPRINHEVFMRRIAQECCVRTGVKEIFLFQTETVLFLLLPQEKNLASFSRKIVKIADVWNSQIQVHHFDNHNQKLQLQVSGTQLSDKWPTSTSDRMK